MKKQIRSTNHQEELKELLYQALETEICGIELYRTALRCAVSQELREEWQEYLEQAQKHQRILLEVFERLDLEPNAEPPGRAYVRQTRGLLVAAMETVLESGMPEEAQVVAAECVMEAQTQDHMNWELIGEAGKSIKGEQGEVLREAHELVEEDINRHLYHAIGRTGELGSSL